MIPKPVSALACAAILAFSAGAAQAAPSAHALELSRRYVAAMHMDRMMDSLMANLIPAMVDNMAKKLGGQVPDDTRAAFTEAARESMTAMTPKMIDRMVPIIAESFTEAELQAAVTYYESPAAQSLLAKTPVYMAKVQPALRDLMPEVEADMSSRLCKKIDCTTGAKK